MQGSGGGHEFQEDNLAMLTTVLRGYVPGLSVSAEWREGPIQQMSLSTMKPLETDVQDEAARQFCECNI